VPSLRHCWPERWDGVGDDFTIHQHVEDVGAFIDALGAGPVHLLGHSRGGHVAFRVAQRFPERVRALILAEPGGALDETLQPPHSAAVPRGVSVAEATAKGAERVRQGDAEGGVAAFVDAINGPGAWAASATRTSMWIWALVITCSGTATKAVRRSRGSAQKRRPNSARSR
jgi:pimeloyl-ACP methyl ester carboxylesterase